MTDFHNGAYYPAMALRVGVSPYGDAFAYSFPVARATPAYSPFIIALHLPFTLLPLPQADVAYFLFSIAVSLLTLFLVCAKVQRSPDNQRLKKTSGCLLVGSLPLRLPWRHTTLFNGYFTPILVFGTLLSLSVADRKPWLAAVGFHAGCRKPNYAIPLGLILLARGNLKTLTLGVGISS